MSADPAELGSKYRARYEVELTCGHKNIFCDPEPIPGELLNCGYHGKHYPVVNSTRLYRYKKEKV